MNLDRALIDHLALLARLELSDEEKMRYLAQLGQILGYVEQIQKLPTEGIEPLVHTHEQTNVFREDVARPPLGMKEILANAPDPAAPFFRVPKVME